MVKKNFSKEGFVVRPYKVTFKYKDSIRELLWIPKPPSGVLKYEHD